MKTPEEFRQQAERLLITEWMIRRCSICNVPFGFIFHEGFVFLDTSCGCAISAPKQVTWQEVADQYNKQTNEELKRDMDYFWRFETHDKDG